MLAFRDMIVDQEDLKKTAESRGAQRYAIYLKEGKDLLPKFPLDTDSDVKESVAALKKNAAKLPDEIVETAKHFINREYEARFGKKAFAEIRGALNRNIILRKDINWAKYASKVTHNTERVYALNVDGQPSYDITTSELLKKAMQWYETYAKELPYAYRREFAQNVVKQAEKLGVSVSNYIAKSASDNLDKQAADNILLRAAYLFGEHRDDLRKQYAQLAKEAASMKPEEVYQKLAALDQQLPPSLKRRLPDAYDTVFGFPKRAAKTKKVPVKGVKAGVNVDAMTELEKRALLRNED